MSKVLEEMKTRRSIRKFKPDMIPQDILDRIIEAGTFAANGDRKSTRLNSSHPSSSRMPSSA